MEIIQTGKPTREELFLRFVRLEAEEHEATQQLVNAHIAMTEARETRDAAYNHRQSKRAELMKIRLELVNELRIPQEDVPLDHDPDNPQ